MYIAIAIIVLLATSCDPKAEESIDTSQWDALKISDNWDVPAWTTKRPEYEIDISAWDVTTSKKSKMEARGWFCFKCLTFNLRHFLQCWSCGGTVAKLKKK